MILRPPNSTPAQRVAEIYKEKLEEPKIHLVEPVIETPQDAIEDVLNEAGVSMKKDSTKVNDTFLKYVEEKGGSLEELAQNIVNIASRGETDSGRLRACEFIAKLHGVQVNLDEKPVAKEVTINILNQFAPEGRSLMQFVTPRG